MVELTSKRSTLNKLNNNISNRMQKLNKDSFIEARVEINRQQTKIWLRSVQEFHVGKALVVM